MLVVYTVEQAEEWDSVVSSFENYDVYYLSGYVKAFQVHGDGEPLLIYWEDNGAKAINVVMKRDVAYDVLLKDKIKDKHFFDFTTPYGYGGWLTEGDISFGQLYSEYSDWCVKNDVVSEFLRFHPLLENEKNVDGHYEVVPLGETIAMDLISEDEIWKAITSKNRNSIRKAQKNNVKICVGISEELLEQFRHIYDATMDKDHADKYYYFSEDFYKSVLEDLGDNATIFYAVFEERIIAAAIMIMANGRMNYHLSGTVKEYQYLAPTNLLLYEAAIWGCRNGYKTLYLGGGVGSREDSLFKFKKSFNRNEGHRFYIGKKIFNQTAYNELLKVRFGDSYSEKVVNFFPAYRSKE